MKRRLEEGAKPEGSAPAQPLHPHRPPQTASSIVQTTFPAQSIKNEVTTLQHLPLQTYNTTSNMPSISSIKVGTGGTGGGGGATSPAVAAPQSSGFQRLKVEDALSYLDQVKYKFSNQPQVYNDFLDIMKEFKSQCIDTPGVITRVSGLFKGYPELIIGFNTFLPPGYKIEVQANDTGYSLQVSVSMASPPGTTHHTIPDMPPLIHHQLPSVTNTQQQSQSGGTGGGVGGGGNSGSGGGGSSQVPTSQIPPPNSKSSLSTLGQAIPPSHAASAPAPHHQPLYSNTLNSSSSLVRCDLASVVGKTSSGNLGVSPSPGASPPPPPPPTVNSSLPPSGQQPNHQTSQPVEFNHAINYVNKIKNRFQGQPDKYKKFLEILHTYQKEQRTAKNGGSGGSGGLGGKHLTEAEVYSQVAKLFENQEDLLTEFGQFLPDATNHNSLVALRNKSVGGSMSLIEASTKVCTGNDNISVGGRSSIVNKNSGGSSGISCKGSSDRGGGTTGTPGAYNSSSKGSPPAPKPVTPSQPPAKRLHPNSSILDHYPSMTHHPAKKLKTNSHTPTLSTLAGFENIKKSVRKSSTYDNLLRTIILYNHNLIGRSELMMLMKGILMRYPDQVSWLKELLVAELKVPLSPGPEANGVSNTGVVGSGGGGGGGGTGSNQRLPAPLPPPPPSPAPIQEHHTPLAAAAQSYSTSSSHADLDLSICRRIGTSYCALPKNYSFPKCSGRTSLCKQVLNDVWVSIPNWSEEATFVTSKKTQFEEYIYRCEDERFELDVVIECNASTIRILEGLQKKMSRMSSDELSRFKLDDSLGGSSPTTYARAIRKLYGEKTPDIIEGLKKYPSVAVPIVLKRLKTKEIEWRQAQKGFNKIWREQNEKYYLKSLDHQGINFKPNDLKALRSKTLYNEIEAACDLQNNGEPHLVLSYRSRAVLDDAAELLIYHVKRQTTIQKQDKQRIKQLLRHFLPDMFHHPRQDLSDDEKDQDDKSDVDMSNKEMNGPSRLSPNPLIKEEDIKSDPDEPKSDMQPHQLSPYPDEVYTLFFGNNNWYLFLRLHHILCDRLSKMAERSQIIMEEEAQNSQNRKESTAVALRLKPNEHVADCYGAMLDMVKSVLDCSLEPTTYEDNLRNMFGIHAYIGFTLDRVVTYAVRQLQSVASEEACVECWDLFCRERSKGGGGGLARTHYRRAIQEANYQRAAMASLPNDSCYKFYFYKKESKVTIELLDTDGDEEEEEEEAKPQEKWSNYSDNLVNTSQKLDPMLKPEHREKYGKIVYLKRNLRRWSEKLPKSKADSNSNSSGGSESQKMDHCEETQCRILANNKMLFVVNKDSCLYKKEALSRARESHKSISKSLYRRFTRWHSAWVGRHVSIEAVSSAKTWLLGQREDAVPNLTTVDHRPSPDTTPYRPYNKYQVKYLLSEAGSSGNASVSPPSSNTLSTAPSTTKVITSTTGISSPVGDDSSMSE